MQGISKLSPSLNSACTTGTILLSTYDKNCLSFTKCKIVVILNTLRSQPVQEVILIECTNLSLYDFTDQG